MSFGDEVSELRIPELAEPNRIHDADAISLHLMLRALDRLTPNELSELDLRLRARLESRT